MGLFATGKLKIWNVAIVQLRPQFADLPSPNSDYTSAKAFQNIPILNYQSSVYHNMGLFVTVKLEIWNVAIVQLRPLFADLLSPNSDYTSAWAFQNIPILNYQSSVYHNMGLFATGKLKIWNVAIVQLRPQFADSCRQIRTPPRQKPFKTSPY